MRLKMEWPSTAATKKGRRNKKVFLTREYGSKGYTAERVFRKLRVFVKLRSQFGSKFAPIRAVSIGNSTDIPRGVAVG